MDDYARYKFRVDRSNWLVIKTHKKKPICMVKLAEKDKLITQGLNL